MEIFSKLAARRRNKPDSPRLYPVSTDSNSPAAPHDAGLDDVDLTYEDALADAQFTIFLKREYDAQAPAGSFERLMSSIRYHEASQNPGAAPAPTRKALPPVGALPLRGRLVAALNALGHTLSRPVIARVASGLAAVVFMAAAIGPNLAALNGDKPDQDEYSVNSTMREEQRSREALALHAEAVKAQAAREYDRVALLNADPPDTRVPPMQSPPYLGPAETRPVDDFYRVRKE